MKLRLSYIIATLLIMSACEASGIADVTGGKNYELYDYYVDKHGNEGIVIYKQSKKSGEGTYILVLSLDESECTWGKEGESVADNDTSIRDYDERALFLNQRATYLGLDKFPAFKWCLAKNHSKEYPDINSWILPSLYHNSRLIPSVLQTKHELINRHIVEYGGTPLAKDAYYWLADEPSMTYTDHDVSDYKHSLAFSLSGNYILPKETMAKVRAVKCIRYDQSR